VTVLTAKQQDSDQLLPSHLSTAEKLNLVDIIERILGKGIVINGEITVSLVGTELLSLKINLVIASIETAKRYGIELPWEKWQRERALKESNNEHKKEKIITLKKRKKS
jgi:hypothetical protein